MTDIIELSQALNAKLCHELAGTIGAIENCTELIDSADSIIRNKAIQLINSNAEKLVSSLRLYRYTYGLSQKSEKTSMSEVKTLIDSFLSASKSKISFSLTNNQEVIDPKLGKLITCLFILVFNAIRTGEINIITSLNEITVSATGKQHLLNDKKMDVLTGNFTDALSVHNVHEYYIYHLAKKINCNLNISQTENYVEFQATII